jgi:EAL domain-containing protein (putative c-di-GMP-specific phosphodiesterase class I)
MADLELARDIHAVQPQREIREALRENQLVLHYQPIVRLDTFRITGVEALLRWQHPEGGLLTPDDFLPSLTQTPVMREVTSRVLRLACEEAAHWPQWTIAVNVVATDVNDPEFVSDVVAALDETRTLPTRLTLELTEQSVLQDVELATKNLTALRDLGVGIALDDFGTGYSSLLYLRSLPVTRIKIDRRFTHALNKGPDDDAIVESIVRLAHTINLDVTAEGVETAEQVLFLQRMGCGDGQGFLFGHPRPASLLSEHTPSEWMGSPPRRALRRRRPATDSTTVDRVRSLLAEGASLHTVAAALNRSGSTTHRGGRWSARSVARVVADLPDPD